MDESSARSRHPDSLGQAFLWALLPTLLLVLNAPDATYAQVATNITPSALPACPGPCGVGVTIVAPLPPGQGGTITITGGARPGNGLNLFHSFGRFDVGTGDIANFFNETGLPTSNILSRVTGGNPSQIYGTIQTTDFPGANLFLMNPAGVLFGATAVLDLGAVTGSAVRQPGSFYATTADYLKLVDTNGTSYFYADPVTTSVLSVAPVVAFGFTAPNPVSITLEGSTLMVGQGQTLSIVGGNKPFNKTIQENPLIEEPVPSGVTVTGGTLSAPGGHINLVSIASPGEVLVPSFQTGPNIDGASFTSFGSVSLAADSNINVSGASTVAIRGGQIVLSVNDAVLTTSQTPGSPETISLNPGSSIVTSNSGTGPGADIQLIASNVQMDGASMMDGASIKSATNGNGPGGNISITNAQTVNLTNGAEIKVSTFGSGQGGYVDLTARRSLTLENGSGIITETQLGNGVGGDLSLNVGKLSLLAGPFGKSLIRSNNSSFGTGVGGDVTVQGQGADSSVVLSGGSQITSETLVSGAGGQISLTAKSLDLSGRDTHGDASTIISSTSGTGGGGKIVANVQQASLSGGATITGRTTNAGAGGTVTVQGLEGPGSKASSVRLSGKNTGIVSDSKGSGVPGVLTVNAGILTITNGAAISAGSAISTGPAGEVNITADSILISAAGQIFSRSFDRGASQVTITANELTLDNGSIVTSTLGTGRGGDVVVNAGTVSLTNGASINSQSGSEDPSGKFSTGRAGDITMDVGSLTLANHAEITSSSKGIKENAGDAGTITATGNRVSLASGSSMTSSTTGPGDAGQVIITTPTLSLNDATVTTSTSSTGNAGSIKADVGTLTLTNAAKIASSSTGKMSNAGDAGNITIESGTTVVMNNRSLITTEADQASGGQIEITAPEMVRLTNSKISTSVADGTGGGGNIKIDPQFVILTNSQIIAQAFAGSGGEIHVTANVFIADPFSQEHVSASSQQGPQGTVNIQSPVQNVGGRLTPLSQQFSSAAALLAQRCAARVADGKFSTFVVAGREGLPAEPGGFLASPSLTAELFGSSLSGRYPHTPIAAVTGAFAEYDARPIQLAKFGDACH